MIPEMVRAWREGHDVVQMRRRNRAGRAGSRRRQRALLPRDRPHGHDRHPENVGDFRLRRRARWRRCAGSRSEPVHEGMFAWIGFPCKEIDTTVTGACRRQMELLALWNFAWRHHVVLVFRSRSRAHGLSRRADRLRRGVFIIAKTLSTAIRCRAFRRSSCWCCSSAGCS